MVLVLKQNYRFEDLMLDQASKLESDGDIKGAKIKFNKALRSQHVLRVSKRNILRKQCPYTAEDFDDLTLRNSEPVDWADIPEFNPHYAKAHKVKNRNRRINLRTRLIKRGNRGKLKDEEEE